MSDRREQARAQSKLQAQLERQRVEEACQRQADWRKSIGIVDEPSQIWKDLVGETS
jgi:hypothetical protein